MSDPLVAFFDHFIAAFEDAADGQHSRPECRIATGGKIFHIRFASAVMHAALFPALEHLTVPLNHGAPDDFTLHAWESASTGVSPPRPPWQWKTHAPKGEIPEMSGPRFYGQLNAESGATGLFDSESRRAIYWIADSTTLRGYERAAPFLQIFQWCFERSGRQIAHAAVAGISSGAALLAGKGGSGKSTSAALAHEGGMLHMGDDYCLLGEEPPRVFTFYRSMKLHPHTLDLAPLQTRRGQMAWKADDKEVLLLNHEPPPELPLKILLLPHVTREGATAVRPASPAEALRTVAPSLLFQLGGTQARSFEFFARLVKQIPAYHLNLGADVENVAARIRELLERA